MSKDVYESPLSSRYASPYMLHLFSADMRFQTWRRLWTALARAEHELGLPITAEQVAELEAHITDIDYAVAEQREREVRHDVMAHVYAYGKAAPSAAGIIHLGATSCYVTDNADLILYRDGLRYLRGELLGVLANLAAFAREYAATPTLGYTHYQPAQPVTVGKRAALWMQDFLSDLEELDHILATLKFLGCRGTTGTEASFMDLFDGDGAKIDEMNRRIAAEFGFDRCFSVCGQTYPRKTDSRILNVLSSLAQSAYRMANDIRLLQHDRQVEEPFEKNQIGKPVAYLPNMADAAIETGTAFAERILPFDVLLCTNTGRRQFCGKDKETEEILSESENRIAGIRWLLGGLRGRPPLHGADYLDAFKKAGIGFNLSRYNDVYLYSSDRLAHIIGNGELALIDRATGFADVIPEDGAAFYGSEEEFYDKLAFYKNNADARMKAARKGYEAFYREFDNKTVTAYMAALLSGTFKTPERPWQIVI